MTKGKAAGLSMMLKIVMEVAQYYTVFDHVPPSPQKDLNSKDRTRVYQAGMETAPKSILPGYNK